jgi:hypothetical protein
MSKGPGAVEKRIADLFAATRDRGLSVAEIADHAFQLAGRPASRAQRLSATRAGHRLLRRMREAEQKRAQLVSDTKAAVGERPTREYPSRYAAYKAAHKAYDAAIAALKATESWRLAEKLDAYGKQFGSWTRLVDIGQPSEKEFWRTTADKKGTLYFHPPDVPIRVWAVSVQPAGAIWREVEEIGRITKGFVTVRYAGETVRLDRTRLWELDVNFVSRCIGYAAQNLEGRWQDRYGRARLKPLAIASQLAPSSSARPEPPTILLSLSADEYAAVQAAAAPIHPLQRGAFLKALAVELEKHAVVGPGLVHRLAADLQRLFGVEAHDETSHLAERHEERQAGG